LDGWDSRGTCTGLERWSDMEARDEARGVTLLLGHATPDAMRLPGSHRERKALATDQAAGAEGFASAICMADVPKSYSGMNS
jgi:hypothetical protein